MGGGKNSKKFAIRVKIWHALRAGLLRPPPSENPVAAPDRESPYRLLEKQSFTAQLFGIFLIHWKWRNIIQIDNSFHWIYIVYIDLFLLYQKKNQIKFYYTTVVSVTEWLNFVLILVLNWLYSVRQIFLLPVLIYRRHSIKIKRRR